MKYEYIEVDLDSDQKKIILELAAIYIDDDFTKADLNNGRRKWIRFRSYGISSIIGELSYHFNRCKNAYKFELLDELIGHLENIERDRIRNKSK